jgi:hypothetical protein
MPYEYGTGLIAERVRDALDGTRKIPPQSDSSVAWLTYALYAMNRDLTWFEEYVAVADYLYHDVPSEDEVAWTFLQLKGRGWLLDKGDAYALDVEGRKIIEEIVGGVGVLEGVKKLEEWFASHPVGEGEEGKE